MTLATCTMSHSPLVELNSPASSVRARVDDALAGARRFVSRFSPDLVVLFGPDHYNGFTYRVMPPFCLGYSAHAIGDFGTPSGEVPVDRKLAQQISESLLASGIDIAVSEGMTVDHGFAQPLDFLFGGIDRVPVVPIFVNCVAEPLGPISRSVALGRVVGECLDGGEDRRVLLVGSGGLSHDPPIPKLDGASGAVAELLTGVRETTVEERRERERRVVEVGRTFAAGTAELRDLNPLWDREFIDHLAEGEFELFDKWTNDDITRKAGGSAHEIRTWIAAYAALASAGEYRMLSRFYEAIPEWIAGFGVTTAVAEGSELSN